MVRKSVAIGHGAVIPLINLAGQKILKTDNVTKLGRAKSHTRIAPTKYQISGNNSFRNSFHGNWHSSSASSFSGSTERVHFFAWHNARELQRSRTYTEQVINNEPPSTSEELLTKRVPILPKCLRVQLQFVLTAREMPEHCVLVLAPSLLS